MREQTFLAFDMALLLGWSVGIVLNFALHMDTAQSWLIASAVGVAMFIPFYRASRAP